MLQDVIFAIWFLLPAAAANAAPVFAAAIPMVKRLNAPIDGHKRFRSRQIFGPHKTWRGLLSGICAATLTFWIQRLITAHFDISFIPENIDYTSLPILLLGPLFAIGALGGDAIESFFKRQKNTAPGTAWIPFDQLDYIIGSVLVSLFFVVSSPMQYIWIFVIWFLIHIIASYTGYKLGLKERPI